MNCQIITHQIKNGIEKARMPVNSRDGLREPVHRSRTVHKFEKEDQGLVGGARESPKHQKAVQVQLFTKTGEDSPPPQLLLHGASIQHVQFLGEHLHRFVVLGDLRLHPLRHSDVKRYYCYMFTDDFVAVLHLQLLPGVRGQRCRGVGAESSRQTHEAIHTRIHAVNIGHYNLFGATHLLRT